MKLKDTRKVLFGRAANIFIALALIGVIIFALFKTFAAGGNRVYLTPSTISVNEGDSFSVDLYVNGDDSYQTASASISFPGFVRYNSYTPKTSGLVTNSVAGSPGGSSITVNLSHLIPTTGDLLVGTINMSATDGGNGAVSITGSTMRTLLGVNLEHARSGSTVSSTATPDPDPEPEPTPTPTPTPTPSPTPSPTPTPTPSPTTPSEEEEPTAEEEPADINLEAPSIGDRLVNTLGNLNVDKLKGGASVLDMNKVAATKVFILMSILLPVLFFTSLLLLIKRNRDK